MDSNLDKYSHLEIFMEFICTNDSNMRQRVLEEIDSRKLSGIKKKFLITVCKISIVSLSFSLLQYDDFMYDEKDIKHGFFHMIMPLFVILPFLLAIF